MTTTIEGRGEREKELSARASESIDIGMKPFADVSAEERFYNRSVRIRRKILKWMIENVGNAWRTYSDMDAEAANYAGCGMAAAHRWIFQFSRKGKPFETFEGTDSVMLRERTELT